LPGFETGSWQGRHRFADTSGDLAEFIRAAGLDVPDLVVLGHSWGGMVVAGLPRAGIVPRSLVLLDPPAVSRGTMVSLTESPTEQFYDSIDESRAVVRELYPTWADGDIEAKALSLTKFDVEGVLATLLENGDWDAGLEALSDPSAQDVPVWYVRGEEESGGMIPDAVVPSLATRVGADHVLTIAGGPHSPMRTHPEATVLAILRALEG